MVIVAVLILLQMAFVVNLVVYLSSASVYVYSLLELVSAASVIWLVSKNENPSYKLAWVILIMAFPIVGIVFYLMFGDKRMSLSLIHILPLSRHHRAQDRLDRQRRQVPVREGQPGRDGDVYKRHRMDWWRQMVL